LYQRQDAISAFLERDRQKATTTMPDAYVCARDIIDELIMNVHVYDGTGAVVHILPCVYRTNIKNNDSPNEPCERYNS